MDKRNDIWLKALDTHWVGELRLRVSGRSMYPTLQLGDEVLVESVTATEIRAGDWIVVRTPGGPLLHRFLKFSHTGQLLTKGDALRAPDPPWEPESLLGRVTTIYRDGECMLAATQTFNERVKTLWHRGMAGVWQLLKQGKLLVILWLLFSLPPLLLAAVTLVSFEAQ
ncbi:MAG: hypothetical protein K8R89_05245, partial [Anaerolineae bacterium]|nr:hypothetical protein [Anaerolineae bacterium]